MKLNEKLLNQMKLFIDSRKPDFPLELYTLMCTFALEIKEDFNVTMYVNLLKELT
jgi:hypothetical protein